MLLVIINKIKEDILIINELLDKDKKSEEGSLGSVELSRTQELILSNRGGADFCT